MRGWVEALAEVYVRTSVGLLELMDRARFKRGVEARQLLWMLLHDKYGWSYPDIARKMGFDHSTVIMGVRRARKREKEAPEKTRHFEAFSYKEEVACEALSL
jgi:chromosomal replication initiation ATPase DnaA